MSDPVRVHQYRNGSDTHASFSIRAVETEPSDAAPNCDSADKAEVQGGARKQA